MNIEELATYRQRIADIDTERAGLEEARNGLIRDAHHNGTSVAELSRATGLTRTMLYKILGK